MPFQKQVTRKSSRWCLSGFIAFTFFALTANAAPSQYQLIDLGVLPGDVASEAYSINASGEIAGYSFDSNNKNSAFSYSAGALTPLGTLGGSNSYGIGINDNGDIVGQADRSDSASHAFLLKNGVMTDLGNLGTSNSAFSVAVSVNNADQVVGYSDGIGGSFHAFLYQNGAMSDLGTFGGSSSSAQHINNEGQIVGRATLPPDGIHAFVNHAFLYQNGSMSDLGTLGGLQSFAYGINDRGQVVGQSDLKSGQYSHAFVYQNGKMTDLGTLAADSTAYSINNSGQIVGNVNPFQTLNIETYKDYVNGFLYQDGTMYDLTAQLQDANGWFVNSADAINDQGWIVGAGGDPIPGEPGQYVEHAILLVPIPEPGMPALLGIAATAIILRRRSRLKTNQT